MYRELIELSDKTAVVFGARGGIGSRIVKGLLEFNAKVFAVSRNKKSCEEVFETEKKEFKDNLICLEADPFDEDSLQNLLSEILKYSKTVDILINCVGGNMKEATTDREKPFFNIEIESIRKVIELNLFAGAIVPAKVFVKEMIKNEKGGSIIFVSSMSATRPLTKVGGYGMAKSALENFTRWLATDICLNFNPLLRVNAVAPGFFHTKQNEYLLYNSDGTLTERGKKIIDATPMKRFGKLEETVGAVIWLASGLSSFVTGTVIPVDGGFSAFSGV